MLYLYNISVRVSVNWFSMFNRLINFTIKRGNKNLTHHFLHWGVCVCVCVYKLTNMHMYMFASGMLWCTHVDIRGQLEGICFLRPPCESQVLNLGQQASLPTKSSQGSPWVLFQRKYFYWQVARWITNCYYVNNHRVYMNIIINNVNITVSWLRGSDTRCQLIHVQLPSVLTTQRMCPLTTISPVIRQ